MIKIQENHKPIKIGEMGDDVKYSELVDYVLRYERLKEQDVTVVEIEKLENINFSEYSNMLNLKNNNHEDI